jgi:hypothetical protein
MSQRATQQRAHVRPTMELAEDGDEGGNRGPATNVVELLLRARLRAACGRINGRV